MLQAGASLDPFVRFTPIFNGYESLTPLTALELVTIHMCSKKWDPSNLASDLTLALEAYQGARVRAQALEAWQNATRFVECCLGSQRNNTIITGSAMPMDQARMWGCLWDMHAKACWEHVPIYYIALIGNASHLCMLLDRGLGLSNAQRHAKPWFGNEASADDHRFQKHTPLQLALEHADGGCVEGGGRGRVRGGIGWGG